MEKEIKIGVLGLKRGLCLAESARQNNMKIVAICDYCPEVLEGALPKFSELGIRAYSDYDEFLTHDMDAVIIANFFNEHAPYAIKALNADKHVISECAANITLAEGVALCRAVESTQKVYMIAENYCYTKFILEMRKIYQSGEIGRVLYAEGEYNHPMSTKEFNAIAPGRNHWRNLIPSTYYCTHATAPLMFITDTVPVQVNALSVPAGDMLEGTARKSPDVFAPILLTMDNDAIFRVTGWGLLAGHSNWYRAHGTKGAMEVVRGPGYFGTERVRVWHEPYQVPEGFEADRDYTPDWPFCKELAEKAGHGGGDFWTLYYFAEAIRSNTQPYLDVYKACAMSSIGVLGWKSVLNNGAAFEMPDFKNEASRKKYENDHFNPFDPSQKIPLGIKGTREHSQKDIELAQSEWADKKEV